MSIKCPQCGAEFDVTLFTFDRRIRCDCGAWVDLTSGHQETTETGVLHAPIASDVTELSSTHEAALLAVSRTTYTRVMTMAPGNVSAAQLAIAEKLRQTGFALHEDNEELIARLPTIFAVLADGRSVQRLGAGEWVVLRDYV